MSIEPRGATEATFNATGIKDPKRSRGIYRQLNSHLTLEEFEKVKKYALEHDMSMSEVIRQLIDIL